jgi:hypothetical protein
MPMDKPRPDPLPMDSHLEGTKSGSEAAKGDMIKRVAVLMIAQSALLAALVKLL